ncbi:MAG: hypothetical protein QGF71_07665, partial [Rhodospirillales bacterium]|nr:hypothetical protein [Rhodospirillales bacterium]
MPVNARASQIDLHGYKLKTLYKNLGKLPVKLVAVVLEACFSGISNAGSLVNNASPIILKTKKTAVPRNVTVIAADAANQIASWEKDGSSSLF